MKELSITEVSEVSGGVDLFNLGATIAALAIALIGGGPATLGMALCGLVMAKGINEMDGMYHEQPDQQLNQK